MPIPKDYEERVYAGVLGKIIGVYLGRPFEGWTHERILNQLGEIDYYVHDKLGKPLIVADDDISGTFTFIRALEDYGITRNLTAEQIGQTWLNYIVEEKTTLWWGGMGNSTEHTAYLRLKRGIRAPRSGSMESNTCEVAEQIGAQIFIDGWAMVAPGEPDLAAELARKAGSVSHDGEAIYGAQVVAAMESAAFVERDLNKLFDIGTSLIPHDSTIYRLIADLREWAGADRDWKRTFRRIQSKYGYDKFGGNCHMVPNHAVIALALLYGEDDFRKSLLIANTAGWDTDCNSGNVGCLMGIKNGLASIDAGPDWRGPVADELFIISADGERSVTNAAQVSYYLSSMGRKLLGAEVHPSPKGGAKYHFELPGSVQGFRGYEGAKVRNVTGQGSSGNRSLAVVLKDISSGRVGRIFTKTFGSPTDLKIEGYQPLMTPRLYSGQTVRASLIGDQSLPGEVAARLVAQIYPETGPDLSLLYGPEVGLSAGLSKTLSWTVPSTGGLPIAAIGVEFSSEGLTSGNVYLDYLTWDGEPEVDFRMFRQETRTSPVLFWLNASDHCYVDRYEEGSGLRVIQNEGTGLQITGTREWRDYTFSALVSPHMARRTGLAVRVQGMKRYYALSLVEGNIIRLSKELDGEKTLAEKEFKWEANGLYSFSLAAEGDRLIASIDGKTIFDLRDTDRPLTSGGVALLVTEGRSHFRDMGVHGRR